MKKELERILCSHQGLSSKDKKEFFNKFTAHQDKLTTANTLIDQVKWKMQSIVDTLSPNDFATWVIDLKEVIAAIEAFKGRM